MSIEDAMSFLARMAEDDEFCEEARSARTADQFWSLVKQADLEFTREEYLQAEQAREQWPLADPPPDSASFLQRAFASYCNSGKEV
jgi:hypothetical protein